MTPFSIKAGKRQSIYKSKVRVKNIIQMTIQMGLEAKKERNRMAQRRHRSRKKEKELRLDKKLENLEKVLTDIKAATFSGSLELVRSICYREDQSRLFGGNVPPQAATKFDATKFKSSHMPQASKESQTRQSLPLFSPFNQIEDIYPINNNLYYWNNNWGFNNETDSADPMELLNNMPSVTGEDPGFWASINHNWKDLPESNQIEGEAMDLLNNQLVVDYPYSSITDGK